MHFSVDTKVLRKSLSIVNHATANTSTTPILENILLQVRNSELILTSNNLEMAIESKINTHLTIIKEWDFSLPSKLLTSYIGLISEDTVEIELTENETVLIKTMSSDFKIKWIEAEEFPLNPGIREVNSFEINSKTLRNGIDKTLFSSAEWNIRPTLAWIFFNILGNEICLASTDSFRLSEFKTRISEEVENPFSQIIPSKTCNELRNLTEDDEEIRIITWENQVCFMFGNTKLFSRLLNWKFPDYSNFFPNTHKTKAIIEKSELSWALKKANLISKENNYSVRISFSKESGVLIETNETQIWEGKVELNWSIEWEESSIGINSNYMLDALNSIESSHVSIAFENALSPIMVKPAFDEKEETRKSWDFRHIIMPLKV